MTSEAVTIASDLRANVSPVRGQRILRWRNSLLGKVAAFMLLGVFLAYAAGATAGFVMLERGLREQWRNQAEMNAQIVTSVIRGIYTSLVVDSDARGQVIRIVSELPIGDETSILITGFNPLDVLALASAQTKNEVWLFQKDPQRNTFVSVAGSGAALAGSAPAGAEIVFLNAERPMPDSTSSFIGFATVAGVKHLVASVPVVASRGEVHGLVVTSIGTSDFLFETRDTLVKQSLLMLVAVLAVTTAIVALLMRRLFRPVPVLIQALTRIANNDTGVITPFQGRNDEIGQLADAVETLREAVVEREHLREVREATLQFEHMAHHDHLTGLPNRAYLNKALAKSFDELAHGQQINFMMLDLDRFKPVNDTHGHSVGDTLLVAVANRLSLLLGPDDLVARLGGDEFAIIQHIYHDSQKEGRRLAQRIVEMLGTPFVVGGCQLNIGTSVGIACAPEDGRTAHDLLTRADAALYASKRNGRGTYAFYADRHEGSDTCRAFGI